MGDKGNRVERGGEREKGGDRRMKMKPKGRREERVEGLAGKV